MVEEKFVKKNIGVLGEDIFAEYALIFFIIGAFLMLIRLVLLQDEFYLTIMGIASGLLLIGAIKYLKQREIIYVKR